MAWRKWVVRGLVFAIAAAIGAGVVAYQHWTDPAEVRRQVLGQLAARFPGANVTVESARLRPSEALPSASCAWRAATTPT
jgi:O-antigen ligase